MTISAYERGRTKLQEATLTRLRKAFEREGILMHEHGIHVMPVNPLSWTEVGT